MIEQIASVGVGFHLPNAGSDIFSLTEQEDLYGNGYIMNYSEEKGYQV